ncbi:MAG TPA: divergent polysaccharide deacetylase family protein [Roseibacterium sp.]|nr:divergent polysaccharide deacetylase family protein [Roseibacterium sp.]
MAENADSVAEAATADTSLTTEIPLPSGTEFNRPPPEPEAALPSPDLAPTATVPQALQPGADITAPSFDTASAAQPNVSAEAPAPIAALDGSGEALASPASPVAAPAPAPALTTGPAALSQPEASDTPQVRTALLPQAPEPEAAVAVAVEAETPTDTPEDIVAPDPDPTPDPTLDPTPVPLQTPTFPNIGNATGPTADAPDLPSDEVVGLITPAVPQATGLPQVAPVEAAAPEAAVEADTEPEPTGPLPAIRAHAVAFDDAAEQRPLMAIVLIDEPDSRIDISTLTRFSFPVAFAVDPLHPDAAARAAAYREAGFEVVILGSMIPEGATASDTEVVFAAAQVTLPEAVALIDTPEGRIQGDRAVLDATVAALAESGHGLLAFPRGLNAAEQSASRIGVPGVTLFRLLDDEGQRATVITRFLSRAAFTATQEGTVIVAGHTRPDTVTALFSWALGGRSEAVALAPLSATMLRASAP